MPIDEEEIYDEDVEELETEEDEDEESYDDEEDENPEDSEDEEESSEEDEDGFSEITYEDENGEMVTEKVSNNDLVSAWKLAKIAPAKFKEYEAALKDLEGFTSDATFRDIIEFRKRKYTDDQILYGLWKLRQDAGAAEVEPEFTTVEEAVEYRLNKRIKEEIEPLKRSLYERAVAEEQEKMMETNNIILDSVVRQYGWEVAEIYENEAAMKKMGTVLKQLYPGLSLATQKLSQLQAEALIEKSIGVKSEATPEASKLAKQIISKAKPSIAAIKKNNSAPKVLGSGNTKGKRGEESRLSKIEQRERKISELF